METGRSRVIHREHQRSETACHLGRAVLAILIVGIAAGPPGGAATPGLPFIEDFTDTALQDPSQTNADWSTWRGALLLPPAKRFFEPFNDTLVHEDITTDGFDTDSIAVGDMDGDGDLDLVTAEVAWYPRLYLNGGGTPIAWTTSSIGVGGGISGGQVLVADVNLDGALDVLVTNPGNGPRLYINNTTSDPLDIPLSQKSFTADTGVTTAAVGDVDGDGDPDFVFGNNGANVLWLNDGDPLGTAWTAGNMPVDARPTTVVKLADIDGDGDLDLVEGNDGERSYLYLNNGTADPWNGVSGWALAPSSSTTADLVVVDLDGDGDLDIAQSRDGFSDMMMFNDGGSPPSWDWFTWGSGPDFTSYTVGDVDGDGDIDLAGGSATDKARLLNNAGTSRVLGGLSEIGASTAPAPHVALADIDGDGALDLVVAGNGVNRLYRNVGSPNPWHGQTIGTAVPFLGSRQTRGVAVGDVNGDGELDLVYAGNGPEPNELYLNNGTLAPFSAVTPQAITGDIHNSHSIALGDVDGDGDLDAVVGNFTERNRLYLNQGGDPIVWSGHDITTDAHATHDVALADVDRDGDLDVVAGNYGEVNRVYFNGGGTPISWTGANISSETNATNGVAIGDVDGDGDLDLIDGAYGIPSRVFLNNGTANPWNGVSGTNVNAWSTTTLCVKLGDLDGDGDLDLVEGTADEDRIYRNEIGSAWAGHLLTVDSIETRAIDLADVDNDGDLDILAVSADSLEPSRLYTNEGPWAHPALFSSSHLGTDVGLGFAVALGDIQRNGQVDVVVGYWSDPGRYYQHPSAAFPWNRFSGTDVSTDIRNSRDGTLGDVDGDGDLDLVVANLVGTNRLHLNNGTEEPWLDVVPADITSDDHFTTGVVLGDVDADGDLDLVAGNAGQANRLYRNDGGLPLLWTGFDITTDAYQTNDVALVDVDRDGDLDLLTAEAGSANRWYRNDGGDPPVWTGADLFADFDFSTSLAVGDVDRDGDPDVMVGTTDSPNRLYLNGGGSPVTWSRTDVTADLYATWSVVFVDADADGDLDALAGNLGQVNRFYVNEGGAPIVWTADDVGTVENTRALAIVDIDRDGDPDLAIGNEGEPNRLLFQDPTDEILDMTSDAHSTYGLVVGDVDGDGDPDVVAINGSAPPRLYRNVRYDTVRGRATSLSVDGPLANHTNALLDATATYPPGTRADWWMSNDDGQRWWKVQSGQPFPFHYQADDLRWRVDLISASPSLTPVVDQVDISEEYHPAWLGDHVWEDLDGDGLQDVGEPGIVSALVYLLDQNDVIEDFTFTDTNGDYVFYSLTWGDEYTLMFIPPTGYTIAPRNQGSDDAHDSDATAAGRIDLTLRGFDYHTRWDAGMVPSVACMPPDEPVYIYTMTLTTDGNNYPVLHFMDPNQPDAISGYNVYRSSDPVPPPSTWPLVATDIIDMDEATANKQWVDTSGDVSPSGSWYYQITAYNHRCPAQDAEGPF